MKRNCLLLIISAVLLTASESYAKGWPVKVEQIPGTIAMHKGMGLDMQTEFGVSLVGGGSSLPDRFFLRQRAGFLYFYEPWFFSVGATIEGLGMPGLAGGVETEVSNLSFGGWMQGGISVGKDHTFLHAGIGWSVFGAEWQHQVFGTEGRAHALLIKVRLPLGIILAGLKMR